MGQGSIRDAGGTRSSRIDPLHGEEVDNAYRLALRRADEVHELDECDLITIAAEARRKAVIAPATLPLHPEARRP